MIVTFKNPVLQQIADDCGLYISEHNAEATSREIEFFVMEVLGTCINRVNINGLNIEAEIANDLKEHFGIK